MNDHYYGVLRVDKVRGWRWQSMMKPCCAAGHSFSPGPLLVQRCLPEAHVQISDGELSECGECARVQAFAKLYRQRLHDLSWFLRVAKLYLLHALAVCCIQPTKPMQTAFEPGLSCNTNR